MSTAPYCIHCGAPQFMTRDGQRYCLTIGVEIPTEYDGVLFWMCPSCKGLWHRWSQRSDLRDKAQAVMDRWNQSFTCVHCGARSRNSHDIANRYCGACHHFCDEVEREP